MFSNAVALCSCVAWLGYDDEVCFSGFRGPSIKSSDHKLLDIVLSSQPGTVRLVLKIV